MIELTDSETAVLIDALDRLRGLGPNVESALKKINSLMRPSTVGLRVEAISS